MRSFAERSMEKELLDRNDISFEDIRRNMQELNTINSLLGGHHITLTGMRKLTSNHTGPFRVVEIGCGGGDNLRIIRRWADRRKLAVHLSGIDINPECIAFAESQEVNKNIHFIRSDYRTAEVNADIIFSSLFCLHFTDPQLVELLLWMKQRSRYGFFINDLHRHPLAWHSIRLLTRMFSKSYLVKNDAPLSVKRGFVRKDWKQIFDTAGIHNFDISWKWAFRWLIVYRQ